MPQDLIFDQPAHQVLGYLATAFQLLIVPAAIVLALALGRRLVTSGYWVLALPWAVNIGLCWYVDVGEQWESGSMLPRYTYASLPLLGMFVVTSVLTLFRRVRPLLVTVAASSVFLVILWIRLLPSVRSA